MWEYVLRRVNERVADLLPSERAHTISILDFAGFGVLSENSFEQV